MGGGSQVGLSGGIWLRSRSANTRSVRIGLMIFMRNDLLLIRYRPDTF